MAADELVRVGVVGDYQPDHQTHPATTAAIQHAAAHGGYRVEATWIGTDAVDSAVPGLRDYAGIWIAPESPYRSLLGALRVITMARTREVPLLGTCAGFQHIVLEFARNVLGIDDAQHTEYDPTASSLFVTPLSCALAGRQFTVELVAGTTAARAYGTATATERYYCNFGINPDRRVDLESSGLVNSGVDPDHHSEARIVELPGHPFFVGTLFVPQMTSTPGRPHPLVVGFLQAAARAVSVSQP